MLQISCAALLIGTLQTIVGKGTAGKTYQLISRIVMIFVVISPLTQLHGNIFFESPISFYRTGQDIVRDTQEDVLCSASDIIIEQVRSYIMDEAESLNAVVEIEEICLDPQTWIPTSIQLRGPISPYDKAMLTDYIQTAIGIEKEAQKWS